jgi:hypothetical protein
LITQVSLAAAVSSVIGEFQAKSAYGYLMCAGMGDELIQLFQGMKKNGAMGFLCSAVAFEFLGAVGEEKCYDEERKEEKEEVSLGWNFRQYMPNATCSHRLCPTNSTSEDASQNPETITSALASSPDLSTYRKLLNATSPDVFIMLDGSFPASETISIFAPSNKVFEAMGGSGRILQSSSQPFSSYLLKYPFINMTPAGQEKSIA